MTCDITHMSHVMRDINFPGVPRIPKMYDTRISGPYAAFILAPAAIYESKMGVGGKNAPNLF